MCALALSEEPADRPVITMMNTETRPSSALRAPTTITNPRTSSALANSDPMIDVWATTVSPAESAKITMKNSGRFPSVDCMKPVTAGP